MLDEQIKNAWTAYKAHFKERSIDPNLATELYLSEVWPLLLKKWRTNPPIKIDGGMPEHELSIHTLGSSPEATVLAALAIGAQTVVIFYTSRTEEHIPFIEESLGKPVLKWEVSKSNPSRIYKQAKKLLDDNSYSNIAFDITSGTKAMTAGLAAFGFFSQAVEGRKLDINVYYVDNDAYDRDLRRPVAGHEYLVKLSSPFMVFGDIKLAQAKSHYSEHAFASAEFIFRKLYEETRNGEYYNFAELSLAYAKWRSLEFSGAAKVLSRLINYLSGDAAHEDPLRNELPLLRRQLGGLVSINSLIESCSKHGRASEQCLQAMANGDSAAWLSHTLLDLAETNFRRDRFVISALYLYRTIELIAQHLLALRGINAQCYNPEAVSENTLQRMENLLAESVQGEEARMPQKRDGLTLLNSLALIAAHEDSKLPFIREDIGSLRSIIGARNESMLIHGLRATSKKDAVKLRELATRIMNAVFPDDPNLNPVSLG